MGQSDNAARVHRLLAYLFCLFALIALVLPVFGGMEPLFLYAVNVAFFICLAAGNYMIARGARERASWAQGASVVMGVLLVALGVLLFVVSGNQMSDKENMGTAYTGFFKGLSGVVELVAGLYILLNSNWKRPAPLDETDDSDPGT